MLGNSVWVYHMKSTLIPNKNSSTKTQAINKVNQRCVPDHNENNMTRNINIHAKGILEASNFTSANTMTFYYCRVQRSQNSSEYKVNIEINHCYVYKR